MVRLPGDGKQDMNGLSCCFPETSYGKNLQVMALEFALSLGFDGMVAWKRAFRAILLPTVPKRRTARW
jgi:hypothetical protein